MNAGKCPRIFMGPLKMSSASLTTLRGVSIVLFATVDRSCLTQTRRATEKVEEDQFARSPKRKKSKRSMWCKGNVWAGGYGVFPILITDGSWLLGILPCQISVRVWSRQVIDMLRRCQCASGLATIRAERSTRRQLDRYGVGIKAGEPERTSWCYARKRACERRSWSQSASLTEKMIMCIASRIAPLVVWASIASQRRIGSMSPLCTPPETQEVNFFALV
mmetsp:Transcript_78387/g.147995  ORF Transcript_78387/g.147995 Transcript_78387/m.147995 type:complete len:220 (+) Transcript_78387:355-1014(+)